MAIRLRRHHAEPRLEMMPLLDVVFLLLTFFAFALMVMVRADTLDVDLPVIDPTGSARQSAEPIVISLASDGRFAFGGEFIERDQLLDRVSGAIAERPDAPVLLEIDVASESGQLIELVQELRGAGIEQFSILGNREDLAEPEPTVID